MFSPATKKWALLSYRYWQAHYGGSPSIIGRALNFDRHPRIIIGVMPPRFLWRGADVYLPVQMTNGPTVEGQRYFALVGRLKPGVTEAQAAAELRPIFQEFTLAAPYIFPKNLGLGILPFDEMFKSDLASTIHLLLGSVFVLLFIACVNVSGLLLARAVKREHEFIVRASIGATRMRLVRHALTESLLLALAALPVALGFAFVALKAILRIVPTDTIPDEAVVTMNFPVLLGSLGLALATVVIFGMAPAWPDNKTRLANDAFTVVGVMSDLPFFVGFRENYPHIFLPYTTAPQAASTLVLSTSLPTDELVNPIRQAIHAIDKDQPVIDVMSLRQMLDMYGYAGPRFSLALFGTFAAAALLLSLIGIYGVLSFITSQRTQEIGIRMALGADRRRVMTMVLRQAFLLSLLGVAIGLPLAFVAGRLASKELVQTSQHDPVALIAAVCILLVLGAAATFVPARQAAALNPVSALRSE